MEIRNYIHREVPFAFCGTRLSFALSLGLFSSGGIDTGTKLLMKSLAGMVKTAPDGIRRIVDIGSGVGVIGVSLAAALPGAVVHMLDRDALAVAFSRYNAAKNGVSNAVVAGALGLSRLPGEADPSCSGAEEDLPTAGYDLIVSNVPAKAGEPVHAELCRRAVGALGTGGIGAFVVVHPIADSILAALVRAGAEIVFTEAGSGHLVLHFRRADGSAPVAKQDYGLDSCYIRHRGRHRLASGPIDLSTCWGLPEFDTPSYATGIASSVVAAKGAADGMGRSALFWEPGQGHLPVVYAQAVGSSSITLAGRDALSLMASMANVSNACPDCRIRIVHVPSISDVEAVSGNAVFSDIVTTHQPVSGTPVVDEIVAAAKSLLGPAGRLVTAGSSQEMYRLETAAKHAFTIRENQKHRGARAIVFGRK